jgi:hypothetical protein
MSEEPSTNELYEMAKLRGRDIGVIACLPVREQLARIKENKKSGRVEHSTHEEHLTIDFFDLTEIIYDGGSRPLNSGDERRHWRIEIQGATKLGATLRVFLHLFKDTDKPLEIAGFHQILDV